MIGSVFISYRRDDSRYQARIIYTAFTEVVPREHVFMDIDSIPLGADFRRILKGWVDKCDVLLALIGPGWLNATDPRTGQPRLMNPNDFVRIEIAEALARGIPVVPVLLDGARLPDPTQLPDDLKDLVYRNAEFVDYARFNDDVARLIRKIQQGEPTVTSLAVAEVAVGSPLSTADRLEHDAWEAAVNQDTELAYRYFLEEYPNGQFSENAYTLIGFNKIDEARLPEAKKALFRSIHPITGEITSKAWREFWSECSDLLDEDEYHSLDAYIDFLEEYEDEAKKNPQHPEMVGGPPNPPEIKILE